MAAILLLQAPASPAHTLDRFLPQRLQDEAAAASSAREAAAAAVKPEKQTRMSSPTPQLPTASLLPAAEPPTTPYVSQASQPYVTPMPPSAKLNSQASLFQNAENGGREHAKRKKHQIDIPADVGQGDGTVQVEHGLDLLKLDDLENNDDDLEAPSSFCCPITTVSLWWLCCCCCSVLLSSLLSSLLLGYTGAGLALLLFYYASAPVVVFFSTTCSSTVTAACMYLLAGLLCDRQHTKHLGCFCGCCKSVNCLWASA